MNLPSKNKIIGLALLAALVFSVTMAVRGTKRSPAQSPALSPLAAPPPTTPPASPPTKVKAEPTPAVDESDVDNSAAPESLRRSLPGILALLPSELRARARIRLSPLMEDSPVWIARLEIDGVHVEQSDVQLGEEKGKAKMYSEPYFPYAQKEVKKFPDLDNGSFLEKIAELLKGEGAELSSVEPAERSWWPNRGIGLTPCLNYSVQYTNAEKTPQDETWCLNAGSGHVEFRRSNVRR